MRLLRRMRTAIPAAALLPALLLAAPAGATPSDGEFLEQLSRDGVAFTDFRAMLEYAHGICTSLDQGVPHLTVIDNVMSDQPQLDRDHAVVLTISSYLAYCPWHALPGSGTETASGVAYA
ncbi:DUF732 domain-containing protein [Mycobacterium sp. NPDC050041]|uniref:DUF732 domain-containing protein n=1 Tax=Mycobacterium sp. NPDC050041 TaxID=3364293 RepID=UPI003C2DDAAE